MLGKSLGAIVIAALIYLFYAIANHIERNEPKE